jgi:hypothetical protein
MYSISLFGIVAINPLLYYEYILILKMVKLRRKARLSDYKPK